MKDVFHNLRVITGEKLKKEEKNGEKSLCFGLNWVAKKHEGCTSLLLSHKTCILNYVECFLLNETD